MIKYNHKIKENLRSRAFEMAFWGVMLLILFVFFTNLFSRLTTTDSDYQTHLQVAIDLFRKHDSHISAYPLYHFAVKVIAHFLTKDYYSANILVLSAFSVLSILAYNLLLNEMIHPDCISKRIAIYLCSVALVFFGTISSTFTEGRYYARQGSPNPWHNPTIIAVRPIAILSLFFLYRIVDNRVRYNHTEYKDVISLGIAMMLSVYFKPSWGIVIIPAVGLYILHLVLMDLRGNLLYGVYLVLGFIPAGIAMICQVSFNKGMSSLAASSFGVAFGGWSGLSALGIVGASISTFPVCIMVFICLKRKCEKHYMLLLGYVLLVGWMEMFFLTDGHYGDFSWGYDLAIGACTAMALGLTIKEMWLKTEMLWILSIFLQQVVSGGYYLWLYYSTGNFWK